MACSARQPVPPRLPVCLSHLRPSLPHTRPWDLGPSSSAGRLHGARPGWGPGLSPASWAVTSGSFLTPRPQLAAGGGRGRAFRPGALLVVPGPAAPCQRGGIHAGARLGGGQAGVGCRGAILRFSIKGWNWEPHRPRARDAPQAPTRQSRLLVPLPPSKAGDSPGPDEDPEGQPVPRDPSVSGPWFRGVGLRSLSRPLGRSPSEDERRPRPPAHIRAGCCLRG